MRVSTPTARALAEKFGCTERTIFRLKARGVDITNPEAVTAALIRQQCRSTPMLQRVSEILDSLPTDQSPV
jgi:hypothetical protein